MDDLIEGLVSFFVTFLLLPCLLNVFSSDSEININNTEKSIINELINLKDVFTIVLITHKLSNLKLADKIIKIENKKIVNVK